MGSVRAVMTKETSTAGSGSKGGAGREEDYEIAPSAVENNLQLSPNCRILFFFLTIYSCLRQNVCFYCYM